MSAMSEEHRELLEEKLAEEARWYQRRPIGWGPWSSEIEDDEPEDDDRGVQWDSGEEEDDEDVEDDEPEDLPNYFVADF